MLRKCVSLCFRHRVSPENPVYDGPSLCLTARNKLAYAREAIAKRRFERGFHDLRFAPRGGDPMLQQNEVLDRLRHQQTDTPLWGQRIGDLNLQDQVIDFPLNLAGARIVGPVNLSRSKLLSGMRASRAVFEQPVIANDSHVTGNVLLANSAFLSTLDLSWAEINGRLHAWRARFHGDALFYHMVCSPGQQRDLARVFPGEVNFSWSWFYGKALFERTHFNGPAYFWRTRFFGYCSFNESCFFRDAAFMGKVSEICLSRDEVGPELFAKLHSTGLMRFGTEQYEIVNGTKLPITGHLNVNSLQELRSKMNEAKMSEDEKNCIEADYLQHSGPMFANEMSFQRVRIEQPKQVQFMGVNARDWNLAGTEMDAISYFNAEQESVPRQVGLGHIYRTVFVSYGGPDEAAARRLYDALIRSGVTAYFYKENAMAGRVIDEEMLSQIQKHDHVLLICSRAAPDRRGWRFELEAALKREELEGNGKVLLPVSIDDCLTADSPWERDPLLRNLWQRNVTPFEGTFDDPALFNKGLGRILRALEISKSQT